MVLRGYNAVVKLKPYLAATSNLRGGLDLVGLDAAWMRSSRHCGGGTIPQGPGALPSALLLQPSPCAILVFLIYLIPASLAWLLSLYQYTIPTPAPRHDIARQTTIR